MKMLSENLASVPVAGYSWLIEASAICIPRYNVVDSGSSPVVFCVNRCSLTLLAVKSNRLCPI